MEWVRLHHESVTGRDRYSDFYKKDITFNVLGPVGDKVEEWTLKGEIYSIGTNFNELDYHQNVSDISLTLRYDYHNTTILRRKLCRQYLKTIMNTTRNQ